jgi:hypothetical protein
MSRRENTLALSLVSHTNIGKTTLARTLLGRDIGSVRDATHVTDFADEHRMVETPQGECLTLWDTPGFGDSVRLAKRMQQADQPIGWLLTEVWDRWRDRAFWASQMALRNVRDEADVVLYLVSAAESPEAAGYVAPEMELLAWTGLPVIVLLNQLGAPGKPGQDAAEVERWRKHLAGQPQVRAVLALDAFARCWVQELTLLQAIEVALPPGRQPLMGRLRGVWQARHLATFDAAMRMLADSLARIAHARETVPEAGTLRLAVRQVGSALGLRREDGDPRLKAQEALLARLDSEVRSSTSDLLRLHALEGQAAAEDILTRVGSQFDRRERVGTGKAAVIGGMVSGALTGLGADLAMGGLTLGGGLITGGVLGALGAMGLAHGVNLVRGLDESWLGWQSEALDAAVEAALLRYLAVAHFGRGRGQWAQSEAPAYWREVAAAALAPHRGDFDRIWADRSKPEVTEAATAEQLADLLEQVGRQVLGVLYPEVSVGWSARAATTPAVSVVVPAV